MGCFKRERLGDLCAQPLQQIWRDHLLAGSLHAEGNDMDGLFVFLYPKDNQHCHRAQRAYQDCLLDNDTFLAWTLEDVSAAIQRRTQSAWIDRFADRYLTFDKLSER